MSYWRLSVEKNLVSVVEDYDYSNQCRDNFLRDPENKQHLLKFSTENEAIQYLNEKIKPEHIDPKWYREGQDHLFK